MPQYKYCRVQYHRGDEQVVAEHIVADTDVETIASGVSFIIVFNKLGGMGWRLVSSDSENGRYMYYFEKIVE